LEIHARQSSLEYSCDVLLLISFAAFIVQLAAAAAA
jgi:hypothetical protein